MSHTIESIQGLLERDLAPAAFVAALGELAEQHPAARHPLLGDLAAGRAADLAGALTQLLSEYHHYGRGFTRYVAAAMASLDRAEHRAALIGNLAEEAGALDDEHAAELRAAGIDPAWAAAPHPELFRRFLAAIGLDPARLAARPPHVATATWIAAFERMCGASAGQAIGALGLATEGIVRVMYGLLVRAIERAWPGLDRRDRVFFDLHALVDDDHAEVMRTIAVDLAATAEGRRQLAIGVVGALSSRVAFFDAMAAMLASARPLERAA